MLADGLTKLAVVIYGITFLLIPYLDRPKLLNYPWLFPTVLIAAVIRLLAEMLNFGLYVYRHDSAWVITNLLMVTLSVLFDSLRLNGLWPRRYRVCDDRNGIGHSSRPQILSA
jgi:hypothetical protein